MIFEAIAATLSLDAGWWIHVILANLFWVVGFAVAAYYFFGNKRTFSGFILIVFMMWVFLDFTHYSGWYFNVATFLALYYISRLALLGFIENIPSMQKNLAFILSMQFIVLYIIYNIFMRAW